MAKKKKNTPRSQWLQGVAAMRKAAKTIADSEARKAIARREKKLGSRGSVGEQLPSTSGIKKNKILPASADLRPRRVHRGRSGFVTHTPVINTSNEHSSEKPVRRTPKYQDVTGVSRRNKMLTKKKTRNPKP